MTSPGVRRGAELGPTGFELSPGAALGGGVEEHEAHEAAQVLLAHLGREPEVERSLDERIAAERRQREEVAAVLLRRLRRGEGTGDTLEQIRCPALARRPCRPVLRQHGPRRPGTASRSLRRA